MTLNGFKTQQYMMVEKKLAKNINNKKHTT